MSHPPSSRRHTHVVMCAGVSGLWVPLDSFPNEPKARAYLAAEEVSDRVNGFITKWRYRIDLVPPGAKPISSVYDARMRRNRKR